MRYSVLELDPASLELQVAPQLPVVAFGAAVPAMAARRAFSLPARGVNAFTLPDLPPEGSGVRDGTTSLPRGERRRAQRQDIDAPPARRSVRERHRSWKLRTPPGSPDGSSPTADGSVVA